MILADTDVLIDTLRGQTDAQRSLTRLVEHGLLAVSAVSAFELFSGRATDRQRQGISDLLGAANLLPFDEGAATISGQIRRELEAMGLGIGMADYLIAGTALSHGLPILTRNRCHFGRVEGLVLVAPDSPLP